MELKKLEWAELSRNEKRLWHAALEARKYARAPRSGISVGAAVLTDIGNVYAGWNDEETFGGPKLDHAEIAAIRAMKYAELDEEIEAIMVVALLDKENPNDRGFPCLECRGGILDATGNLNLAVYGAGLTGNIYKIALGELCPYPSPLRKERLARSPSSRLRRIEGGEK